ncbi:hypothetical protein ACWDTG_13235 [Rhodococcus zopfii]
MDGIDGPVWNRRRFLAGMTGTAAALVGVTCLFSTEATARPAAGAPPVRDTIGGILAFVVPGNDPYSRRQGMSTDRVGGATDGAMASLEHTFDHASPVPLLGRAAGNLPGAAAVAALVNMYAVTVDARSIAGPFAAPFANLSHTAKARVFELLDSEPQFTGTMLTYVVNAIPTLAAFAAYSEASAFDPDRRVLTGRPAGWELTRYAGVGDGWDEFEGYYRDVDRIED